MDKVSRVRIGSLFSFWSLPGAGLLFWACDILGYIHLGAFGIEVGGRVMEAAHAHPIWVIVAGFAAILISIFWPSIKPLLPKRSPTIHERVHKLDKDVPELTSEHGGLCLRVDGMESKLTVLEDFARESSPQIEGANILVKEHQTALASLTTSVDGIFPLLREYREDISGLGTRVQNVEKGVGALVGTADNLRVALDRLNQHDNLFASIDRVSKGTNDRIDASYQRTTDLVGRVNTLIDARNKFFKYDLLGYSVFMLEITRLIDQAEQIEDHLREFGHIFADKEVATAPFSKPWWRKDLPLVAPTAVIEWALFVNRHIEHCGAFAATFGTSLLLSKNMSDLTSFGNAMSMENSLSVVKSHRVRLLSVRQDHAANFCAEAVKVIIS